MARQPRFLDESTAAGRAAAPRRADVNDGPAAAGSVKVDREEKAAIARESAARYRSFVSELNRTRDGEIDKALQRERMLADR